MERHWRADGHTVPNADVYPWQWLWDSCFHALIWQELGDSDQATLDALAALKEASIHLYEAEYPPPSDENGDPLSREMDAVDHDRFVSRLLQFQTMDEAAVLLGAPTVLKRS